MKYSQCLMMLVLAALAGCQTSKDVNTERLTNAESMLAAGNEQGAFDLLSTYIYTGSVYGERARVIVDKTPAFKAKYSDFLRARIAESRSAPLLEDRFAEVGKAQSRNLITPAQAEELTRFADQTAANGNRSNTLQFDLSDNIQNFPSLGKPEAHAIIFRRSIDKLSAQTYEGSKMIKAVFEKAAVAGPKSAEYNMLTAALPTLRLSADEIREYVVPVLPNHAHKMLAERSVTVRLVVEPEDRLLYEDLASKVRQLSGNITLVTSGESAAVTVTVRKLQWEERREPERTQPVVYPDYDVNIVAAVMLMPRNASYIYDLTTGGVELAYAFEIKAVGKTMAPYDKLLRDKANRSWRSCSNARIQNVFGGIQRADFIANDHMRQTCNNGGAPVGPEDLRDSALAEAARTIRAIPAIERVVSLR